MKTILDDPEGFFESGGWSFLDPDSAVSASCTLKITHVFLKEQNLCVNTVQWILIRPQLFGVVLTIMTF